MTASGSTAVDCLHYEDSTSKNPKLATLKQSDFLNDVPFSPFSPADVTNSSSGDASMNVKTKVFIPVPTDSQH